MENKQRIAIIGGGVSGLSIAHCLKDKFHIQVFEKESRPGGLIKCDWEDGNLYHKVGGHVFNSRNQEVLDWFWKFFDKNDFVKAERNAVVSMPDSKIVGYPIENHVYMLNDSIINAFLDDMISIIKHQNTSADNFEDFLKNKFGAALYELYFKPYNEKIWKRDLKTVPLSWLEGKLPMPSVKEMLYNNFNHVKEQQMVHSSFYYAKRNGSQFIADTLSKDINIAFNQQIRSIEKLQDQWIINNETFDKVVFCGNIKDLPKLIQGFELDSIKNKIDLLEYHGTTTVFCRIDKNPYSWIYMPSKEYDAHRIICTGNFSSFNNKSDDEMTATIEFTDSISKEAILSQLKHIPFNPQYLTHHYEKYTYPIQDMTTKETIESVKAIMQPHHFYLLGRFAEWEYYNMDAAMGAALKLEKKIK